MDENSFDVTVIGTGLTESIVAAALAKTGLHVLHIDTDANYGSSDASLTLIDVHHLLLSPPPGLADISVPVPITEELLRQSRDYAISLAPSVVPSISPLIDTLIKSGVSRYVKFKLLDGVGLYASIPSPSSSENEASDENGPIGTVKTVPGSKEDVFKSKELGLLQKRKLMKFLMSTASNLESTLGTDQQKISFLEYLTSKEVGLAPDVADAVAYALSLSSDPKEPTSLAIKRLQKYIKSTGRHGNSPFLIGHFGGAGEIAQGFCRAAAVAGATYILGRKFTIQPPSTSQPPASAPASSSDESTSELNRPLNPFSLSFDDIDDTLTTQVIVSRSLNLVSTPLSDQIEQTSPSRKLARCIAILDGPIYFSRPSPTDGDPQPESEDFDEEVDIAKGIVDSAILVFPPGSLIPSSHSLDSRGERGVVTAFISGPNSLACPDGKRIVYLSTEIRAGESPEVTLQPYLNAIQRLNRPKEETSPVLMSLFYTQDVLPARRSDERLTVERASEGKQRPPGPSSRPAAALVQLHPPTAHLAEFGDEAAEEAERVFWTVMQRMGLDGRLPDSEDHTYESSLHMPRSDENMGSAGTGRSETQMAQEDGHVDENDNQDTMEKVVAMWPKLVEESGDDGW
ncbi:hypothetical protein M408DRAFT_9392 [Serendipita vermifera MAFF 305830]|uniref:Rab proteins geranylgeranyltransferase n=1 Tax=Serendipita vermifera MAFF 305830 TaxID=933852 RepID=A0A0C3B6X6_SERVB|nr:hypothetical protein M408DRAFT_9392 [Serendipita vermifera MAFF 305830]